MATPDRTRSSSLQGIRKGAGRGRRKGRSDVGEVRAWGIWQKHNYEYHQGEHCLVPNIENPFDHTETWFCLLLK
jgi:hypothetical protein